MAFVKFPIKTNPPINTYEELGERVAQDDAMAIYWEAECLWRGEHISRNADLAAKYFQIAALMGSPNAYYRLGEMYRYGQSVRKNVDLACLLFQGAYALGVKKALVAYALVLLEDIKTEEAIIEGRILLKYAKENGEEDADYYIEEYYPEAVDIVVNLNITEVMLNEWIAEALDGILKDIKRQVEHNYLLMGRLCYCHEDAIFFTKVEMILEEWQNAYMKVDNKVEVAREDDVSDERENIDKLTNSISLKFDYNKKKNDIGQATGTVLGIDGNASVLFGMRKFNASQGHGYAAERANHLLDLFQGKNSAILGNDNAYGGPDRCVNGIYLQSKYCITGASCIKKAFDENGYKYMVDGKPMPIEVPADNKIYQDAVKAMREKIANGEVTGVSNPSEAETLVRRGNVTYQQAMNIAKAGTIESIVYDAANGVVVSTSAFGISAMVTFAAAIWNGEDWKEAIRMSVESGLKVAGTTFVSSVLSAQIVRVVNHTVVGNVIEKGAKEVFKHLNPKVAEFYLKSHQCGIINIYNEPMNRASELFKNNLITGSVTVALMSIPSAVDLFRGRISGKQMFKDVSTTIATVEGGIVGQNIGRVIGARLIPIPKVGAFLGGLAGAALCSYFAQSATKYVLDSFIQDDAEEMLLIIEDVFVKMVNDYIVTESEAIDIMEDVQERLDAKLLKDMYASDDREEFAETLMMDLFEDTLCHRTPVIVPEINEMLSAMNHLLDSIADKYIKIA